MIPNEIYYENLELVSKFSNINGVVVECGVWKGGMIAGIANILGLNRKYYLFDSFEGLPKAKDIDGDLAIKWQSDTSSDWYFDNCSADRRFAEQAMKLSGAENYYIEKGWFENTLIDYPFSDKIAVLRLDCDWYDSTFLCLEELFPKVVKNGLIIIDDYYTWDGCAIAVHDYLSKYKLACRIRMTNKGICYIIKNE